MPDCIQVTVTFGDEPTALRLARSLVEAHLAASAQVSGPITSTFRWKGHIHRKEEWHLFLKTRSGLVEAIEEHVGARYPSETPEITALPMVDGSRAYLDWILEETHM
jgi:periplasmic divalent cation tolerance protein